MAKLIDIANRNNLSIGATSRILNHDSTLVVSDEVRLSVLKTALELGYRTPRQKKSSDSEIKIAIADWNVVPSSEIPHYDYSLLLPSSATGRSYSFCRLEKNKPASADIVLAIGLFTKAELDELILTSYNLIFLDSESNDFDFDRITVDFAVAIREALDYLQKKCCSRIAFIGGQRKENNMVIGRRRMNSIKSLLQERGLFNPDLFFNGELLSECGADLMKKALEASPDAIILGSQIFEAGSLPVYGSSAEKPVLVLYRDIELEPQPSAYPVIRMSTGQLWDMILILAESRIRKQGDAVKIICRASFEPNDPALG